MRVLVAADRIGPLSSAEAGARLALGWADHDVAMVPIGEAGAGWLQSLADQLDTELGLLPTGSEQRVGAALRTPEMIALAVEPTAGSAGLDPAASSRPVGVALDAALDDVGTAPGTVAIDLTGVDAHDAGAGFLAALGARADVDLTRGVAGLGAALTAVDVDAVRGRLDGIELIGIVPQEQLRTPLLGLRGITSVAGRELGMDTHQMLAIDGNLERWVGLVDGPAAGQPGAGACGGLGWAVLALGGRLVSGTQHLGQRVDLAGLARASDLVVTGCSLFDFARRGGGAVATVAALAEAALRPCIAVAGEVLIGGREMRTMGIEAAYPAPGIDGADPRTALSAAARRVARSWSW